MAEELLRLWVNRAVYTGLRLCKDGPEKKETHAAFLAHEQTPEYQDTKGNLGNRNRRDTWLLDGKTVSSMFCCMIISSYC